MEVTDRKLLEAAAKAAGYWDDLEWYGENLRWNDIYSAKHQEVWNPLTNDGDAFQLMVKLSLDDKAASIRRNIVRKAVALSKPGES